MSADILAYRARYGQNRPATEIAVRDDAVDESKALRIIEQTPADDEANDGGRRAELTKLVEGLLSASAKIDPKYFYDLQGSALYGAICALDEYYPTRTETRIFESRRDEIAAALPRNAQWVDLGCGDCAKSRSWLRAFANSRNGGDRYFGKGAAEDSESAVARFVGVDIARDWLAPSLAAVGAEFTATPCVGVVADFTHRFDLRGLLAERPDSPPVFFYPGSSIGNFDRESALDFLKTVRNHLASHPSRGRLLVGVDLVKDQGVVEAAYDDAIGVTAAFNRNVLRVVNRLIGSDFVPERFEHLAFFNRDESRIEMHLRASVAHDVRIGGRDDERTRRFEAGETIVTEYSYKYTIETFGALLQEAGFGAQRCWTDEREWFGVWLAGLDPEPNSKPNADA